MKPILFSLLLSVSSAIAGTGELKRFERQTLWNEITWSSPDFRLIGWHTDRGTIRVENRIRHAEYSANLLIRGKTGKVEDYRDQCRRVFRPGKLEEYDELKLDMRINPWATELLYKSPTGDHFRWADVENRPKITAVKVSVIPNQSGVSSEVGNYERYIHSVHAALSRQLLPQLDQILRTGEAVFDLRREYALNVFACDLALDLVKLDFTFDVEMEPARAMTHNWVEEEEFSQIYEDLSQHSKTSALRAYQAGLIVGQAIQKRFVKPDVLKNDRDQKLLDSLFSKKDGLYELKALAPDELRVLFADLPEVQESSVRATVKTHSIELDRLSVTAEAL